MNFPSIKSDGSLCLLLVVESGVTSFVRLPHQFYELVLEFVILLKIQVSQYCLKMADVLIKDLESVKAMVSGKTIGLTLTE